MEKEKTKEMREEQVERALVSGEFFSGFGELGVDEGAPSCLPEALFAQPLVQALLGEGDEGVGVLAPETGNGWMEASKAMEFLACKVEEVGDVTEGIRNMKFL